MTNYTSGRRYEYKIMDSLKGYYSIRTAGSHSKFDVIAFRLDAEEGALIRTIQSKSGKKPVISKAELKELQYLRKMLPSIVSVELWLWTKGISEPEIKILTKGKTYE